MRRQEPPNDPIPRCASAKPSSFASAALPLSLACEHDGRAWSALEVVPCAPLALTPFSRVLHYGQSVFEGLKATRSSSGPALFRPRCHLERFNRSAARLCIPPIDVDAAHAALVEFVAAHADSVPPPPAALYVRPFAYCTDEGLAPDPGAAYRFQVVFSPIAPLFSDGTGERMVRLTTDPLRSRAARGGTGWIKCAGNYAGTMLAKRAARAAGFDEVLWLDSATGRFVEETGSMNVMFVRQGRLITPPLQDTILPGITRATLLWLAQELDIPTEERALAIDSDEWRDVTEAFSAGTAAGTAPIGLIEHAGRALFRAEARGPVCALLSRAYAATVQGRRPAPEGWYVPCPRPRALQRGT